MAIRGNGNASAVLGFKLHRIDVPQRPLGSVRVWIIIGDLGMRALLILTTIAGVVAPRMSVTCTRNVTIRSRAAWPLAGELENVGESR
jgi:hypothetical protein